jgi:bromodomain-containing factor 1
MTANQDFNSNNPSQNDFGVGGTVRSNGPPKASEFFLTSDQVKQLAKFLPPGYSLGASKTPKILPKRVPISVLNIDDSRVQSNAGEKKKREAYYKAEQKLKEPIDFYRRSEYILNRLKSHRFADPFLEPVDPEVLGIPDYFQVIKEPMDFSKVEKRLRSGFYKASSDFEHDVRKIWENATTYNKPNTEIYNMTIEMGTFFEQLLKEEETGYSGPPISKYSSTKSTKKPTDYDAVDAPYRPPKIIATTKHVLDKPLSFQEKKNLSDMIRQLPSESLWEVWRIVSPENQNQNETLEFDIDTLSPKIARQLENYVKSKLSTLNNKKNKVKSGQAFKEDKSGGPWNIGPQTISPAPTTQPGLGQPRDTIAPPTVDTKLQKENTSNSSFLSDLSRSDD